MPKLISVPALALAALLLSGCTSSTNAGGGRPTGPVPSMSATASAESTSSREPVPDDSDAAAGTAEPTPSTPTSKPAVSVEPAIQTGPPPAEPVASEVTQAAPEASGIPPIGEHQSAAYPQPADAPRPTITMPPGLLRIGGSGYAPGERIDVVFGPMNSDYNLLSPGGGARPEPVSVRAGGDGSYTFDIYVSADLAPGEYGILTMAPDRGRETPGASEESKRFLTVIITS